MLIIVPVPSSIDTWIRTHVQLRGRINDFLKLRPLITASHTWKSMMDTQ